MTVDATRIKTNTIDTGRTFPAKALSPAVLTDLNGGIVCERITGPGPNLTVVLSMPASAVKNVQQFVTATGVAAAKEYLSSPGDYTLVGSNVNGVGALTNATATDETANTWVVWYVPANTDKTYGGQSSAKH